MLSRLQKTNQGQTMLLGISSIEWGGHTPDEHFFKYTGYLLFVRARVSPSFYTEFFGGQISIFFCDVDLLGDSHVQRHRSSHSELKHAEAVIT